MGIFLSVCSLRAAPGGLSIWNNLGILIVWQSQESGYLQAGSESLTHDVEAEWLF